MSLFSKTFKDLSWISYFKRLLKTLKTRGDPGCKWSRLSMGARRGGGKSRRSPPPHYLWGLFATFPQCAGLFVDFFSLWGAFSLCAFWLLFLRLGRLFGLVPLTKISASAHGSIQSSRVNLTVG